MDDFPFKNETYEINGVCMDVQRTPGFGFSEVISKTAMEMEFIGNNLLYRRENELSVMYKGKNLQHKFSADLIFQDRVIIEVNPVTKELLKPI
ncbi:MAG: GxxExxY protein [Chitinophagaceae bacterium]